MLSIIHVVILKSSKCYLNDDKNILPINPHSWMRGCIFGYDLSSCANTSLDLPTKHHQSSLKCGPSNTIPSALAFFSPLSPILGFCVGIHVSAALPWELPHYSQSGAH